MIRMRRLVHAVAVVHSSPALPSSIETRPADDLLSSGGKPRPPFRRAKLEFGCNVNPNGIASHSPRLPYSATLGRRTAMRPNPNGVAPLPRGI